MYWPCISYYSLFSSQTQSLPLPLWVLATGAPRWLMEALAQGPASPGPEPTSPPLAEPPGMCY